MFKDLVKGFVGSAVVAAGTIVGFAVGTDVYNTLSEPEKRKKLKNKITSFCKKEEETQ